LTFATFLRAEFGFFGVRIKIFTQIPFFWGQCCKAGVLLILFFFFWQYFDKAD